MSERPKKRFLHRMVLENFRSIASASIEFEPLTFLVGPNGAGKSNVLDALRLITTGLDSSLPMALEQLGGPNVLRRLGGREDFSSFGIRLDLELPSGARGTYAVRIEGNVHNAYSVRAEQCRFPGAHFAVRDGVVEDSSFDAMPPCLPHLLYLVNAANRPEFRAVFDALRGMAVYNIVPEHMFGPSNTSRGTWLASDGANLGAIWRNLETLDPQAKLRIEDYLGHITAGIERVESAGSRRRALEFLLRVEGSDSLLRLPGESMSDGTLRALGVLVALFQSHESGALHLVAIEEPEAAIHPGATEVLLDALREASEQVQVIVTSHSSDLLDDRKLPASAIRAVSSEGGATRITKLDEKRRQLLIDEMHTAGELMRMGQLIADPDRVEETPTEPILPFDEV